MSHLYGDGRLNSQTLNVNLTMVGDLCPPQAKLREWRRAPAPTRFRYTNARIEKPPSAQYGTSPVPRGRNQWRGDRHQH